MQSFLTNMMRSKNVTPAYSGNGYLAGEAPAIATINGFAARCHILLINDTSKILLSRTTSKVDGTWSFQNLNPNMRFTIIALDPEMGYNAVIQHGVLPYVPA